MEPPRRGLVDRGARMTGELVLAALNMALQQRKPEVSCTTATRAASTPRSSSGKRCREMGVRPSRGSVGDAYDNAMAESFFASLECELIDRRSFKTKTEARLALFTYIEGWYNPRRRHSALAYARRSYFERSHRNAQPQRVEHGLPTAGVGVACATPRWITHQRGPSNRLEIQAQNSPRDGVKTSQQRAFPLGYVPPTCAKPGFWAERCRPSLDPPPSQVGPLE
jgi:hypothetical protein